MAWKSFSWYSLLFWWAILCYELTERLCCGGEVVDRIKAALGRSEGWADFGLIYGFSSFMYRLYVLGTWWYALLGEDAFIVFYLPDFEFTFLAADGNIYHIDITSLQSPLALGNVPLPLCRGKWCLHIYFFLLLCQSTIQTDLEGIPQQLRLRKRWASCTGRVPCE